MTSVRVPGLPKPIAVKAIAELWCRVELHGLETPRLAVEFETKTQDRVNLVVSLAGTWEADRALRAWANMWWRETLHTNPPSHDRPPAGISIGLPGHHFSLRRSSLLSDRYPAAGRQRRGHRQRLLARADSPCGLPRTTGFARSGRLAGDVTQPAIQNERLGLSTPGPALSDTVLERPVGLKEH